MTEVIVWVPAVELGTEIDSWLEMLTGLDSAMMEVVSVPPVVTVTVDLSPAEDEIVESETAMVEAVEESGADAELSVVAVVVVDSMGVVCEMNVVDCVFSVEVV